MSGVFLHPDWPVSGPVRALTTQRHHPGLPGSSEGPWRGLNLGAHVGDQPRHVAANRSVVRQAAGLPAEPQWLDQVHGRHVLYLSGAAPEAPADAAWTDRPGRVCAILTADCLPVFLAHEAGRWVGLAHTGWRGLAEGVIEATVAAMPGPASALHAWLGPAIGPAAFQVGEEVREAFVARDPEAEAAFQADGPEHWRADLPALARRRLEALGVASVGGDGLCTWSDPARFFSHRRQAPCGRMASLIWIEPEA